MISKRQTVNKVFKKIKKKEIFVNTFNKYMQINLNVENNYKIFTIKLIKINLTLKIF